MKSLLYKVVPEGFWNGIHKMWAVLANLWYGRPSEKMVVVGVTGTNGKSSTCLILARILEAAGYTVGMSSGLVIKIGKDEQLNPEHMTMPGRHYLHRRLREMVRAGCDVAIVETTSEGIKQGRHLGVVYDVAVFTNLAPEHLASHEGSLEKYRGEKEKMFAGLAGSKRKKEWILKQVQDDNTKKGGGGTVSKVIVVNGDDEQAEHFLKHDADQKVVFGIVSEEFSGSRLGGRDDNMEKGSLPPIRRAWDDPVKEPAALTGQAGSGTNVVATSVEYEKEGTRFVVGEQEFRTKLLSSMNVYNAMAALSAARALGVSDEAIQEGLDATTGIPGRMEFIENNRGIYALVEHAHTPDAYEKLFPFLKEVFPDSRFIAAFGSAGGGRDATKRPKLGAIAARYCDELVLMEEDSYDTPTMEILDDIEKGILRQAQDDNKNVSVHKFETRQEGIEKAVSLAERGDLVMILGKGAEPTVKRKDSEIPWDDREVLRDVLGK